MNRLLQQPSNAPHLDSANQPKNSALSPAKAKKSSDFEALEAAAAVVGAMAPVVVVEWVVAAVAVRSILRH